MKTLPALLASLVILPAQADSAGRMEQGAQPPMKIDMKTCAKPVWPKESLRREETGRVTLEFLIGVDGKVLESKVLESSGHPLLDLAAQDGLAKCQFTAVAGAIRTEPTRTRMQYVWSLEEGKSPAEQKAEWQSDLAAAERGDSAAQWKVATAYLMGRADVAKNPAEGLRWLRASAEQGNVHALEALAMQLMAGRYLPADEKQATELLEKAIALGSTNAQFILAMSLSGPKSTPADQARVRALMEQALAGGNKRARMPVALFLLQDGGASKAEGLRLIQESADDQDRAAQYTLATFYEKGEHVDADRAKALALYERAAAAGFPLAKTAVARLKQQDAK